MSVLVLNQPTCQCSSCQSGYGCGTHNAAPSGIREVPDDDPMLDGMRIGELVANERRKAISAPAPAAEVVERYAADPHHGENFTVNEVTEEWPPRLDYAEISRMTPSDLLPVG
jgi:hypothetical protein